MLLRVVAFLSLFVSFSFIISYQSTTQARADSETCQKFVVIYVRGSGQKTEGLQPERDKLRDELLRYGVKSSNFIELKDSLDSSGVYKYKAISVTGGFIDTFRGFEAVITRGSLGGYSKSVEGGKNLLLKHLEQTNYLKCNTKIVLSGYSQGAEVIGEAVNDPRFNKVKGLVTYIALFGDPSLDIQSINAGNIFYKPPWFKGDAVKFVSGGITSPRNPYFTDDMYSKVGSWCIKTDLICTGIVPFVVNEKIQRTHSKYPEKFIPEAAKEIAKRLKDDLPNLDIGFNCTQKPLDVVLTVDISEAARRDYVFYGKYPDSNPADGYYEKDGPRYTADSLFKAGCDVRVAVVGFGGEADGLPRVISDFSSNPGQVAESIRSLYKEDGSSERVRTQAREGIITATEMDWRNDARRSILFVTNSMSTGWDISNRYPLDRQKDYLNQPLTKQAIMAARAKGVSIFTAPLAHTATTPTTGMLLDIPELQQAFAIPTGGKRFTQGCYTYSNWMCANLTSARTYMNNRIDVSVPDITMKVGETKTIAYSDRSQGLIDKLKKAKNSVGTQWFTNCDNLNEMTAIGGEVKLTPTKPMDCYVSMKVVTNGGIGCFICAEWFDMLPSGIATFRLTVQPASYVPPPAPGRITNLVQNVYPDRREVTWDAPAGSAGDIVYVIKDKDGSVLGLTTTRKLTITDTKPADDSDTTVAAVSQDGAGEPVGLDNAKVVDNTVRQPVIKVRPGPTPENGIHQDKNQLADDTAIIDTSPQSEELRPVVSNQAANEPSDEPPAGSSAPTPQFAPTAQSTPAVLGESKLSPAHQTAQATPVTPKHTAKSKPTQSGLPQGIWFYGSAATGLFMWLLFLRRKRKSMVKNEA